MSFIDKSIFVSQNEERLYSESRSHKKREQYQFHFIYAHGALSHAKGQSRFLNELVENYQDSLVSYFDFSGHGKSSGRKAFVKELKDYNQQLLAFIDLKRKEVKAKFVVLIGYSMGGLVSLDILDQTQISAQVDLIILVNPCLKLSDDHLAKVVRKVSSLDVLGKVRIPVLAPASSLTNDEEIVKEIEKDSLRSPHITARLLSELQEVASKVRLRNVVKHPPILFLVSGADVTVQPEITRVYAQGFKTSLCEVKYYKYAKHDLLNEVNRQDVYKDIKNWLEQF